MAYYLRHRKRRNCLDPEEESGNSIPYERVWETGNQHIMTLLGVGLLKNEKSEDNGNPQYHRSPPALNWLYGSCGKKGGKCRSCNYP